MKKQQHTPTLTIIMCVYNEMGRIQRALAEVEAALEGRSESVEVIILDNCSKDGTREWLDQQCPAGMRVEFNDRNLGKGGSIKKGIRMSHGSYVVIHDPDLEYQAEDIWSLFDLARQTGASLVLGSRILGGQIRYKYLQNYLGVKFLAWLINRVYGCNVTDAATATKLIEGNLARRLKLESSGFALDFELVVRIARLGGLIEETGVNYYPRSKAEGKKLRAWRDGLLALKVILKDRIVPKSRFCEMDKSEAQLTIRGLPERKGVGT